MRCSRKAAAVETTTTAAPAVATSAMAAMLSQGIARTKGQDRQDASRNARKPKFPAHDFVPLLKNDPNSKTATGQRVVLKC
jgi:hypothetical protein